ncbi:molybdenum ABC transporter substrate-binding protein [Pseudodesulfovibrio cashew]|uniref:Molybdenum ABC transporter substrate-binding protein n=1 Tax=Pseudodesulfovibrio cashew TaxID=2678688 RepID=A0A6I6JJ48_9BACT|nr:substrate-binding domain-containing protein [Pseudodesulfovibrio cashew]QGY40978.1 molybdenum ABC transporter substrate-binding protein [Pseudodesulfovibrio cashew]
MSLTVFSAGSLRKALPAMAEAVGLDLDVLFGPAGLLRRRIEEGERPSLFFSANMDHARAVETLDDYAPARELAVNRLCLFGRREALECGDALAAMLAQENRLGTSTPGADPGGDYAFSVFDRAEAILPGSRERLRAKALPLVGGSLHGKDGPGRSPVPGLFEAGKVDLFLGYRTSALDVVRSVEGLAMVELPPALAVEAIYGVVALRGDPVVAKALALLDSLPATEALEQCGFMRCDGA